MIETTLYTIIECDDCPMQYEYDSHPLRRNTVINIEVAEIMAMDAAMRVAGWDVTNRDHMRCKRCSEEDRMKSRE